MGIKQEVAKDQQRSLKNKLREIQKEIKVEKHNNKHEESPFLQLT